MRVKIMLLADLPVEDKHGAKKDKVFEARLTDQMDAVFIGDAGEEVCAIHDRRTERGRLHREFMVIDE